MLIPGGLGIGLAVVLDLVRARRHGRRTERRIPGFDMGSEFEVRSRSQPTPSQRAMPSERGRTANGGNPLTYDGFPSLGMHAVKVVPSCSVDATVKSPSCAFTISRQM